MVNALLQYRSMNKEVSASLCWKVLVELQEWQTLLHQVDPQHLKKKKLSVTKLRPIQPPLTFTQKSSYNDDNYKTKIAYDNSHEIASKYHLENSNALPWLFLKSMDPCDDFKMIKIMPVKSV